MKRRTKAGPFGRSLSAAVPPALRYPAYRAYWLGSMATVSGYQILQFGQLWLVHELTSSPLYLGYVGLSYSVPAIALSLFGGALADRMDKRRLIVTTQIAFAAFVLLLATLTALELVRVWHVLALAFAGGLVAAFDGPARDALYPHLIARKALLSGVALDSSVWQSTRIVAPAAAGFIIASVGTATAFYVAVVGFLIMAAFIHRLKIEPVVVESRESPVHDLIEGLKFVRKSSTISFVVGLTFFSSFFGMAYIMLMPVFAVDVLGVGADGQGGLLSISGVGALIATVWLSARQSGGREGLLLVGSVTMFGLGVATFALTARFVGYYPLAMAIMFVNGAFASVFIIAAESAVQTTVPDQMRGRVMALFGMTWSIMPLGGMWAGAIANIVGAPFAVAGGGLAVATFGLGSAALNRSLRRLGTLLRSSE